MPHPPSAFPTPSLVLADNLRLLRKNKGISQGELAGQLRAAGLDMWVGPTVAQVEAGTRRVSVDELFVLSLVLRASRDELFATDAGNPERVASRTRTVRLSRLLVAPAGVLLAPTPEYLMHTQQWVDDLLEKTLKRAKVFGVAAEEEALAEEAAARFGTTAADVKKTAARIWYRSFRAERERRLDRSEGGPATLRTRRGHITRELMAELEAVFTRRRKRAQAKKGTSA
ncbi:MAG TPA: helix-turn-helix transcriptional regulator [Candidatus Saccharimonadales bacterium]|nr:helix-turn-helix transcriptional regulator [Candidatus Saccharimonadales bacterium]